MNDDKEKIGLLKNLLGDASDTIRELQKHLRTDSFDATYASKKANDVLAKIKREIGTPKSSGCLVLVTSVFFFIISVYLLINYNF